MERNKLEELMHIADRVAKRLVGEYPSSELEDVRQELYTICVEKQNTIRLFGEGDGPSNPVAYLYREGEKYCQNWVSFSASTTGNAEYSEREVRKQLEDCLSIQTVINTYVPDWSKSFRPKANRRSGSSPLADWDSIYIGTDVKDHLKYLPQEDREVLWRRFVLNDEEFQTNNSMRQKVSRAIKRLTRELNSFKADKGRWLEAHPNGHIGARRVISNEQARSISSSDYAGGD